MRERPAISQDLRSGFVPPRHALRMRAEAEAEGAASRQSSDPWLGPAPHGPRAASLPGFGRPLPDALRRSEEARLGADLSRVRLHDDAPARAALDARGARALAQGHDIAMTPADARAETPEAAHRMRHEIAHTVQQALPGGATLTQCDEEDAPQTGIGRRPPDAPFETMDTPGSEDHHTLFAHDSATLTPQGRAALAAMAEGQAGELVVMIHGYASQEGPAEYNRNLSAHRAVAVRDALLPLLPAGTRFFLHAHGETDSFGEPPHNRRAGVDLITPEDGSFLSMPGPFSLFPRRQTYSFFAPGTLQLRPPGASDPQLPFLSATTPAALGLDLALQRLDPAVTDPPGPRRPAPAPNLWTQPPNRFDATYDWGSVAREAAARGVQFDLRDHDAITGHFNLWGLKYLQLGLSPERAALAAQFGTDIMVGTYLSNAHPYRFELFDRRFGTEPPPTLTIIDEKRMLWIYERVRDMIGN
ncbi:MAG: DUF4157 domain-containing protein [Rhodobacteraceae bacterium]|nr:MAG: DUF4157 domain-containing protein [Paracoccaceae bacterium]